MFKEMAQNIAKSTSDVIGCGVLVTDENGIIIGCNDEKRLGEFHGPSVKVMKENSPMTTSSEDAEGLKNVLPGYTLPIQFYDRVVGSVSIAGSPDEVARYGLLVQKQAEIMFREQAFMESKLLRERALRDLVENIAVFDVRNVNEEFIRIQGRELGYDLSRCRTAIVVQMKKWGEGTAESSFQKMLREVYASFSNPRDLICPQENYSVTIFFSPSFDTAHEHADEAAEMLTDGLIGTLKDKGIEADAAIGFPSSDLAGLARSLRTARDALRLGSQLGSEGVMSAKNFTSEMLLDLLPFPKRGEFVTRTLSGLIGRKDYDEIKKTFLVWCEAPFAVGAAAERLAMHRNSLQYRLKKIRAITGKDPWNFKDAFELWAAFILRDLR
ncbi:MAG: helix-turn-helix domain-containing protein [Synergistaceae bacterium]|nr:helix-turn-helix domain-containing protein [Synergistaceae bacterium]